MYKISRISYETTDVLAFVDLRSNLNLTCVYSIDFYPDEHYLPTV